MSITKLESGNDRINYNRTFLHHLISMVGWTTEDGLIVPDWFEGNNIVPSMFTYTLVEMVEAESQEDTKDTDGFVYSFDNQDEEETDGSDYEL